MMNYPITETIINKLHPDFVPQAYKDDLSAALQTYDGPSIKGFLAEDAQGAFVEVLFSGPSVFAFVYDEYPDRTPLSSIICEYNDDDPQQLTIRLAGEIIESENDVLLFAEIAKFNEYATNSEIQTADI